MVKTKAQVFSLVQMAGKIMGMSTDLIPQDIFEQCAHQQVNRILSELLHVLNSEYVLINT